MAAITAAVVGAGAAIGGVVVAGVSAADAASDRAKAFEAQEAQQVSDRELALEAAKPNANEILLLDRSIQLAESANSRQQRILDATDPALIEAGEQALELLQGKEAQILGPLREQRSRQREELVQRLAARLGPGFETSSAGIRALNQFDAQTSQLSASAQLTAVGALLGTTTQVRAQVDPFGGSAVFGDLAGVAGAPNRRVISAITGAPITGGASFVGAAGRAGARGQIGAGTAVLGTSLLTGAFSGKFGDFGAISTPVGAQAQFTTGAAGSVIPVGTNLGARGTF